MREKRRRERGKEREREREKERKRDKQEDRQRERRERVYGTTSPTHQQHLLHPSSSDTPSLRQSG